MNKAKKALIAAATLLMATPACAAWPERTVQMIVPYTPGAATDIMARAMADSLSEILGQTFVVVNRDGASATIGAAAIAQSRPDGYTIGFSAVGPLTIQPQLMLNLPYKPADFTPICQTVDLVFALSVRQDSRFRNMSDVVAAAKAAPGKLSYGLAGTYSIPHFNMIDLELAHGVKLLHSPYRGDAPTIQALLSGEIDLGVIGLGVSMSNPQLRPLGIFAPARAKDAPEVPTFAEQGFPFAHSVVAGVMGPKGLPEEVTQKLENACAKAIASERYQSLARSSRLPPAFLNAADFKAKIEADIRANETLVKKAGIKAQ